MEGITLAKFTLKSALNGNHGRIDNWVYRQFGDRMIIARRPDIRDPVRRPLYVATTRAREMSLFAFILGDFLNLPVVETIDATATTVTLAT